jgi:hypothetical protein
MNPYVTDGVWQRLDANEGRLGPRAALALRRGTTAVVVALLLTPLAWRSGQVVPRFQAWLSTSSSSPGQFEETFALRNAAWTPVTLLRIGADGPGLELVEARDFRPGTRLGPDDEITVTLVYRVVDCAAAATANGSVPVVVARPWGTWTTPVDVAGSVEWRDRLDWACGQAEFPPN